MFKQNGSISTTSKYRRAAGKNLTNATRAAPRDFLPLVPICPFTQIFLVHLILSEGKKENAGIEIFNIQIPDISACYRQDSNPRHSWNPHVNYHIIKPWKGCELLYKESE